MTEIKEIRSAKIIAALRKNARSKLKDLAHTTGEDIDELNKFIRRETGKTINRFTSLVNFSDLGFSIRLMLVLSVSAKQKEAIKRYLKSHQNTNGIFLINNGYDFFLDMFFRDVKEAHIFCEELSSRYLIYEKKEYFILQTVTEQSFMANPNLLPC